MALESLLGGAVGAIARLAPEVLKFFDRKNERKHELALGQQQFDLVKMQGDNVLRGQEITADSAQMVAGLSAVKEAYASMKTGIPWIDGANQLVRPWITFVVFHAWLAVKIAMFCTLADGGVTWAIALASLWNTEDQLLLSGISTFYFLGRVFEKK